MIIQKIIEKKLVQAFSPLHFQVINESHQHNVPEGSESHFRVVLISDQFMGMRSVQRQQKVFQVLAEEMERIHALTMQTLTSEEWQANPSIAVSPKCLGGDKT